MVYLLRKKPRKLIKLVSQFLLFLAQPLVGEGSSFRPAISLQEKVPLCFFPFIQVSAFINRFIDVSDLPVLSVSVY